MAQTVPVRIGAVEVLVEVTPAAGSEPTSTTGRAVGYITDAFERAEDAIEEIAVSTARTIGRIAHRVGSPERVEVEFGVKISAKGDVIIAGASAEASLKVTIAYGSAAMQAAKEPEADGPEAP